MEVSQLDGLLDFNTSLPGPLSFPEHVSIGVFLILSGIFCGLWQVAALISYIANPSTLWSASMLPEVILLLADLASAGLHPFSGTSAVFNRWLWGPYGCQAYAFAGFLIGTYQLLLVPLIAVVRCVEPNVGAGNKRKLLRPYLIALVLLFCVALFWAVAPLAGLAKYNQTVVRFICTIDWLQNDNLFLVYVSSYTPVVIGVPLITGLIAYLILYVRIKQGTHTVEWATPGLEGLVRSIMHLSPIHAEAADSRILVGHVWRPGFFAYSDGDLTQRRFDRLITHSLAVLLDWLNEFLLDSTLLHKFTGANVIATEHRVISANYVKNCHKNGVWLISWTVNDPLEKKFFVNNINCPLLTDKLSDMSDTLVQRV